MHERRYSIIINDNTEAENMSLEVALITVHALFEKWWNEENLEITIARKERED